MRPPRPRIHLLDTDEPLLAYHELIVRCGLVLKNAEPKFMWAEDVSEAFRVPLGTCRSCMELPQTGENARHYCYGLVEGQAAMNEEDAELLEAAA
jgi:hypothetical protein